MALVRGAVRHYCLGGCSALVLGARRSRPARGGWSRCRVLCLPRFSRSAPCFLRCVWRAVPSGCLLSSLAGTPCHAVCAFRGLGQVALLVFPACPLCVCALALLRRSRPPPLPGLVWRAHLARSRCLVLVGRFHAVRARPRVLPRSRALFGLLGGRRPGPVSPYLAWVCALPVGWVRAWGPVTNPTARALASWLCALWGRHEGAQGGGASCLGVGRPVSGALPPPTTRPFGRAARAHYPLAVDAGGVGVGTRHRPHSARSCVLAWRAVGAASECPGGRLVPGSGASGVGRSPTPDHSSFSGVRPGPTTHWLWLRGCGLTDPSPTPQRALLRAGFARCGGGMRVPGEGTSCLVWGVRGRALSQPRPLVLSGVRPGPTTHWLGCRGCGLGDPSPTPQRALLRAGFARCGGGTRGPGGGASCLGVGRPGSGAPATSTARPFGRVAGAHYPLAWERGRRAWGPVTNPTGRALGSWLCVL